MQVYTLAFIAAISSLAILSPVQAEDYRVLVQHSSQTPTDFCNSWRCACINYVPKDPSLTFQAVLCEPGNFHGQNMNTEAKVVCNMRNSSGKIVNVNKHVAAADGCTIIPDD